MRLRTVIILLGSLLFLDVLFVLGIVVWKMSRSHAAAPRPATTIVAGEERAGSGADATPIQESESPMPTPAPTARFETSPASSGDTAPMRLASGVVIDSPASGQSVPRRFTVSGRSGPLPSGHRLMLVVDSGRGVYSPKMPPLEASGGRWTGACNEFGAPAGGFFSLCVFQVSEEGIRQISRWHAEGKATGNYPPFRGEVPGGTTLARIQLRVAAGGTK